MIFENIADLKDPNDNQGRTYREVNNSTKHKYNIGDLVELQTGARAFIVKLTRDCDGTPLYSLCVDREEENQNDWNTSHGFGECGMVFIK